jgi:hypothetical protein
LEILEASGHGTRYRAHPGVHGFGYEICELLIRSMRLFYVLFGQMAYLLGNFEWVIGRHFLLRLF